MNYNKITLLLLFSLIILSGFSQNEANNWYFGDNAGINFSSGSPVALTDGALSTREGCATISDINGNLLFYTEGTTIWNANHQVMDNGTGLFGDFSSTQSAIIVRKPGSGDLYYVFTVPAAYDPNGANLYYSLVDMSLNGGLGRVTVKNTYLLDPVTERITAVSHSNGVDVWVVTHTRNSNSYYSFLVTSSGVSATGIISNVGTYQGDPVSNYVGYLKASPLGNYVACAMHGTLARFELCNFDRSTGHVSNPISFTGYVGAYGIEFSPDETRLYMGVIRNQAQILQADLTAGSPTGIVNSVTTVGVSPTNEMGALQLGPDQKIYVSLDFSDYLGAINSPNLLGTACDFVHDAVFLDGKNGRLGLPTFIQSYFSANISYENTCFGETTTFSIQTSDPIQSILWNFGDPASGSSNTSTLENPTHIFTAPGTFTITATVVINGVSQDFTTDVQIIEAPPINLGPDQSICSGGSVILDAGAGFDSYLWNTGATSQTITVSTAGTYSVVGTLQDCSSSDAIGVSVEPQATGDAGSDETICQAQPFDFANSAVPPTAVNYSDIFWSGGLGTFTNPHALWPTYLPDINETGNVTLTMEVFGFSPCPSITTSMILTIGGNADADFTVSPGLEVCASTPQTFSGTSASNIVSWQWDFGDGSPIVSGQNVTHTYSTSGTYLVQLNVLSADGCPGEVSHTVFIRQTPSVSFFTTPPSPVCVNQIINFTDASSSNVVSWSWNFGDGSVSSAQNPTHSYATQGNYNVQLTVTNLYNCTNSVSNSMVVVQEPYASMNISPGTTVCAQSAVSFQGIDQNGTAIVTWQWDFGDGTPFSNVQNTTHAYVNPGTYTVELSMTNSGGCEDVVTETITVQEIPVAAFAMLPAGSACLGELIQFTDNSSSDVVLWAWDFGDGTTSILQNPDHSYTSFGWFDVELTVTNSNGCTHSIITPIQIYQLPDLQIDMTPGSTVCANSLISLSGFDRNATTITDWQWDFGDGSPGFSGQTTSHTYSVSGTYTVSLSVINAGGCTDVVTETVVVNEVPTAGFTMSPTGLACEGDIIDFSDACSSDVISWAWDFGDGNLSSDQNPQHAYLNSGVFDVQLIVANQHACAGTATLPMEIFQIPDAQINVVPGNTVCAQSPLSFQGTDNNGTVVVDWQWDFGDGTALVTGQNAIHSYTNAGVYQVTLTTNNQNNCSDVVTTTVFINSLPQCDFSMSPNDSSCVNEVIAFSGVGTADIINWSWQFGDGTTGTGQNTTHAYLTDGTFSVISIVTNGNGCENTASHTRVLVDMSALDFTITPPTSCQNYLVEMNGVGEANFTPWNWDFGDGNSTVGHSVDHTYLQADTVIVSLDVCSQHVEKELIINGTCQVTAGNDTITCQDVYFNLSRLETPPTATNYDSLRWFTSGIGHFDDPRQVAPTYFPDPSEGLTQNDTLTMTMVGYGLAPCGNDTSTMQLVVIPGASAHAGSDESVCFGEPYDFHNSADSSFAMHYATLYWETSGTGHFIDPHVLQPTYVPGPNEMGEVTLTMVAANIINCDSIDEMILTIRPTYEIPVDITLCHYDSIFAQGAWQYNSGIYYDTLATAIYGCDSVIVTNLTVRPKIDHGFTMSTPSPLCLGESIIYTPTGTAQIIDRLWMFGDGTTSTLTTPTHTYQNPGSYQLIYHYTDENGCSDSIVSNIVVNELPDVDFIISDSISCMEAPIDFVGSSTSNINSWQWDFGDGQTGTGQMISHSYTTWGMMQVTLTVTDQNGCSETALHTVSISEPPHPDFTYTLDSCHTIHFEDASTAPSGYFLVAYDWDLGDGTTQDDPIFNHAYADGGIYNVTLTVTADSSGYTCSNTVTMPVIVPNTPTIYYTWDPEPTCLMDTTFFYGASGTPITDWYWNFDDGHDTTGQYAGHVFDNPGTYDVILYITDTNLCQNSLSQQVTINPIPQVSMQIFDSPTCAQSMTTFQGTADTGIEFWYWDFGDGGISEDQNPVHSYTNGGTYTVTLTATDSAGCSATATGEIIVVPTPTADFSYTMSGCNLFAFTDNSTTPAGYQEYSWHWDFGDGFTSDVPDPVHTYATGGFYDVKLVFTSDSLGYQCSDSITKTVQAPNTPGATFTWAPNPAQAGDNIGFFATSGSTITNWDWDFADGGTATGQNATHTYTNPGDYDVSLTVTDANGCTFETVIQVNVGGLPPVDFSWDNACENTPIQFTTDASVTDVGAVAIYDWDFGDGTGSNNQDPLHTYLNANMYNVTLTIIDTLGYTNSITHQVEVMPEPISMFAVSSPNCENSETYFEDYSIALSGYLTTWEWDFGDGNTATINFPDDPDVSHIYPSTGTYTAMLTVTTSDGCQATSTQEVTITPSPIAQIDYDAGCMSGPISFHDVSSENGAGAIIARQWNFGDPASGSSNQSTQSDPTHLFSAAGTYEVTLSIQSQSGCTDADTMEITITDAPEVDFTFTPACMYEPVSFTITDLTNLDQYFWDFGDGHTSQQPDPENTYDSPGDYQVTLTVQTTDGCTATQTQTVTVNPLPQAGFEYSEPTCVGDTIFFLNLSNSPNGAIVKWEWDFGDGNTETILAPNGGNTSHVYANDQSYDVTLTVTDSDSCQNTVTRTVISVASPVAEFNWEDACFGQPTQFYDLTNNTPDIGSWYWDFGDPLSGNTNTSTYQNPTHVFSSPGDYTVTLIVTNTQGCDDTITHDLSVSDAPDVSFTMSSDTLCANTQVSFAGTSTAQISTWYWDFGDGGYALTQNADYLYNAPGTYTVTLTVTDLAGCEASTSEQIVVKDAPLANFSYRNACLGDTTYFTDESYSQLGYIAGWEWDLGDGTTANIQNPTHLYATNDDFQVTLIATDNYGCADTIRQWVKVRTRPIAKIESFVQVCDPAGQVYFFDGSEPGADGNPIQTWEWNLNEGYYSTEIDPEYIYEITDTCYQVTLTVTDDNACYSTDTVEVCVFGQLEVEITADQVCLTQPTTFYANYLPENDSVASYSWNFHDGTPQIITYHDSIQHTFANPGLYNVELMAVDTNGCTAYASLEITIDSLPTPRFSYEAGACDTPMQFTDESLHGGNFIETWLWDFGDPLSSEPNTSTDQNPTHLYSPNDSSYQVKLIVTNFNGCTDSIVQTVYTRACLIANFYVPDTINLCALTEVCFADSSVFLTQNGTITNWDWDFGDGTTESYTSFQSHACHSYQDNQGGTYQVTLTVTGEIGTQTYTNTITKEVLIRPTPMAAIIVQNNCLGDTTFFVDGSETYSEPITTWRWDFGDTSTDADTAIVANPYYIYPGFENYLTELIVANRWGCTDTTTTEVTIYKPPTAEFSWAETCQGYYTYFTDESIADSAQITNYFWHFGDPYTMDSVSEEQNPYHIYDSIDSYTVTMQITDANFCRSQISQELEIYPVPTALFTLTEDWEGRQGQVKLDNLSEGAIDYFWDFDDTYTTTEENPIHQYEYDSDPIYNLTLVATNTYGCPDTLIYPYELLFTGLYVPNAFSPSVADETFNTFKPVGINLSEYKLEVFSSWGNLVFSSTRLENGQVAEGWDGTYEGQPLPTGTYIWRITARFSDDSYWRGSDNGDGNLETHGTVTLIR